MLIHEGKVDRTSQWSVKSLPPEMVEASIKRVGIIASVYAFTFFMIAVFPALIDPITRDYFFSEIENWLAPTASIVTALLVVLAMRADIGRDTKIRLGILFEIIGSYGIAFAEYHDVVSGIVYRDMAGPGGVGLSWVAPWVMLFTIAIPTPPRTALTAALLSVSAVPVVLGLSIAGGGTEYLLTGGQFFVGLILPNLLIVGMAYVGARIVYRMGRAVREAHEMGSYRLVERLGKGAMGEVWRAEHRTLARPAAIKLIRPEVLGAGGVMGADVLQQRFEREAHATALLRSPHTIELYDFGVTDEGTFYYVMELLDGLDLDQLVEQFGPVPPERAVHFLRDLADSLAEAHDAGLVHRDVKPANVYACRQGRDMDFVKVLDFGMVKPTSTLAEDAVKLTADHATGGTPAFMSPEQAVGGKELDGRSDIYAVGCVGYWLLTGGYVFEAKTPIEMLMHHINEEPAPPSRRSELTIPPELDALILRCLSKDPSDRPQTGDELRAALDAVPLNEPWTRARARKWWHEHHVSSVPLASVSYLEAAPRPLVG
jgi:serine/threonine-protein kinase